MFQPSAPSEDFATAATNYEQHMKDKVAEQNRKRICRALIFTCIIVVLICLAVGLGIYFTDQNNEDEEGGA